MGREYFLQFIRRDCVRLAILSRRPFSQNISELTPDLLVTLAHNSTKHPMACTLSEFLSRRRVSRKLLEPESTDTTPPLSAYNETRYYTA